MVSFTEKVLNGKLHFLCSVKFDKLASTTSGNKDVTKFVFKKLDFYIDHDTEAICLYNVGPPCNKKSAIFDMRTALCDMTII